jgi:hypothetical protein
VAVHDALDAWPEWAWNATLDVDKSFELFAKTGHLTEALGDLPDGRKLTAENVDSEFATAVGSAIVDADAAMLKAVVAGLTPLQGAVLRVMTSKPGSTRHMLQHRPEPTECNSNAPVLRPRYTCRNRRWKRFRATRCCGAPRTASTPLEEQGLARVLRLDHRNGGVRPVDPVAAVSLRAAPSS